MRKNRVYYGEYTLKHWINLLLRRNIVLPGYQRTFVWDKNKVNAFLNSINDNLFVPPVTIGCIKKGNSTKNLIIDGQQRLTSILLGVLGIYPRLDKYKLKGLDSIAFADENDYSDDEKKIELGWTFSDLFDDAVDNTIEIIKKNKKTGKEADYEELGLDFMIDENFLENHHLGFSYLVPSEREAQKFFSNTFKNINTAGVSLTPLESRRALYFLAEGMDTFFDPGFLQSIYVYNGGRPERIDFVRYLSFAFQYKKCKDFGSIAKNYGRRYEEYYSEFIVMTVNKEEINFIFSPCKEENIERINKLKSEIEQLGLDKRKFDSIIDVDMFFFGLVYFVIVENKKLLASKKRFLVDEIEKIIETYKKDDKHKKNPSSLKYLRSRLNDSYEIYKGIVDEKS